MNKLIFLLIAFSCCNLAAQEDTYLVKGVVVSTDGKPVEDATVVLISLSTDPHRAVGTGRDGSFEFSTIPAAPFRIWVAKDGFSVFQDSVEKLDDSIPEIHVELVPSTGNKLWDISLIDRDNFRIATKLLAEYETDQALEIFLSFLEKYPYLIRAHYNVGLCYAELAAEARDRDRRENNSELERRAREHFDIVLERYPDYSAALIAKGESLVRTLQMDEAAAIYSTLLKTITNDPLLWYTYAEILSYLDRFDEAVLAYEASIKINPEFIDAHAKIGAIRMSNGDYVEAIRRFELFLSKARRSNMTEETRYLLQQCRAKLHEQQRSKLKKQ